MKSKPSRIAASAAATALMLGLFAGNGAWAQASAPAAARPAQAAKPAAKAKPKAVPAPLLIEARAMDMIKATSARLAAARSMSFTAIVNVEFPSRLGPPLAYAVRYDVSMQRPDKLKIVQSGAGPASEFYYDGKAILAYAPAEDLVAVADAPPTVEGALKTAYDVAGTYFPFTDLLVADPNAALAAEVIHAFYIGPSNAVGGVPTEAIAWASKDVFLQMWIGTDDKLPRRIRAMFANDPLKLRHDMELSNWKLDGVQAADLAAAPKVQAAKRIAFAKPEAAPRPAVGALKQAAKAASAPAKP
jgi:hypothetical protein